ncbi:hypothetical protein [Pseudomonas sp.]|uniref:hypothetical protein n=1 Tax=Pseudomonas sp. TaxID=306 RepID=UPI003F40B819
MNSITAVTDPANPKILEAHGSAGDRLEFDSVYYRDFITAQVPHYSAMARGHTVRVTWENPRHTYHSEVVTVGTPGAIDIRIPRIEVIDAIGHTVKVYYTVRTAPGTALIPSRTLLLHIDPYEFDLLAPTLSTDQKTLSVRYVAMEDGYTVRIRASGKTTWESDEREVQTGVTPTFTLPSNWIAENRGIDTLINYSVYKSGSGQRLMFSKVLRERLGEVVPEPDLFENFDSYSDRSISPGQSFTLASMKVTNLGAQGVVRIMDVGRSPVPGRIERKALVTEGVISILRLDLNSPFSRVRFWYRDVHNVVTAVFYDTGGNRLGQQPLKPYHPDNSPWQLDFSAPGIARIEIHNTHTDIVFYDNFEFTNRG